MSWLYSAQIPIDTSSTGADIASDVANFPLLVRLTPSNFDFSQAKSDGSDIRFEDRNGFPLSYEIDLYNSGSQADFWVSVDDIWGDRADNYIVMRWGNPSASGVSNGQAVFSPSYGYVLAAHLSDPNSLTDSSNTITSSGTSTCTQVSGIAGSGCELVSSYTEYIPFAHNSAHSNSNFVMNANGCTFSIWAYPDDDLDGKGARATLISKGTGWGGVEDQDFLWSVYNGGDIALEAHDGTSWRTAKYDPGSWNTSVWYLLQAVYDGADVQFYRNGSAIGAAQGWDYNFQDGDGMEIMIGRHYSLTDDSWWNGKFDEARLRTEQNSADWNALEYYTQNIDYTNLIAPQFETMSVIRTTLPTSTGQMDIVSPYISGQIPKAVLFFTPNAWTADTEHPDESYGYGMAVDATKQYTFYGFSNDNASNTVTYKGGTDDHCIWIASAGGGSADGEAEFVSFIPSGCRINVDNAPSQAAVTHAVFFVGDDVEADAGLVLPSGTTDAVKTVLTDFEPDLFFLGEIGDNFDATPSTTHFTSFGIGTYYSGVLRQTGLTRWASNNVTGSDVANYISNTYILTEPTNTSSVRYNIELSNPTTSSFDLITRNGTPDSGDDIAYLIVRMPNSAYWVGVEDTPTSTGDWTIETSGVAPSFGLVIGTTIESVDSLDNTSDSNGHTLGLFDINNNYSYTLNDRDGIDPSDNYTRYNSDLAFYVEKNIVSNEVISGVLSSFNNGSMTLSADSVDDEAKKFIVFAYGGYGTEPSGVPVSAVIIDRDVFRGVLRGVYGGVY